MLKNSHKEKLKKPKVINKEEYISWIKINGIENKNAFKKKFSEAKYSFIKQKWHHVWNPKLTKGNWNQLEDLIIFQKFIQTGGAWKKISEYLEGRNRISIRNRYVNSFKSKKLKGNFHLFKELVFNYKLSNIGKNYLKYYFNLKYSMLDN